MSMLGLLWLSALALGPHTSSSVTAEGAAVTRGLQKVKPKLQRCYRSYLRKRKEKEQRCLTLAQTQRDKQRCHPSKSAHNASFQATWVFTKQGRVAQLRTTSRQQTSARFQWCIRRQLGAMPHPVVIGFGTSTKPCTPKQRKKRPRSKCPIVTKTYSYATIPVKHVFHFKTKHKHRRGRSNFSPEIDGKSYVTP